MAEKIERADDTEDLSKDELPKDELPKDDRQERLRLDMGASLGNLQVWLKFAGHGLRNPSLWFVLGMIVLFFSAVLILLLAGA